MIESMTDAAGAAGTDEQAFLSMGLDQQQYEKLEQDFKAVLESMVGEKSMQRFQSEYEKLYRALKTSYESEKRLVKRCKELNETIVGNATRVKAALRLTQEDSGTISLLKKEVDRAWKLVESAKDKEERARKIIQDLRGEIAHLTKIVDNGSTLSVNADNNVQKMIDEKDALKKELTIKVDQLADAESAKAEALEHNNRLMVELQKKESSFKTLTQENEQNVIKINTMMRTQEDEKSKAAQLQEKNEKQLKEIADLTSQRDEAKESFKKEFEQNEAMGKANSELKRTQEQVELNNLKLRQEQQKTERIANDLASQNEEKQKQLDMATMKMNEMERAKRKIQRECVGLENDKTRVTAEKNEAI